MEGIIIKNISNDYTVKSGTTRCICKARGKFKNDKVIPLVGDRCIFDQDKNYITEILPRKNVLIRPSVANIDIAFIITSVKKPDLDTYLLDKLLTVISFNNIKPVICFTKLDLLNKEELKEIDNYINYYEKIGYTVVTNDNIKQIKEIIKNKIIVFTGQSGAGKSTLLNNLDKNLKLKTAEISEALGRGKHTTRHNELYEIAGGYIVDTPGFSSVDFHNMKKIDIRDNMKEMFDNLDECKYRDCMHDKEDNCMVKEKVLRNEILSSRYNNYISFIRG